MHVGVDTGGTFTDLVVGSGPDAGRVVKVPSTPAAPADAVRAAVEMLVTEREPSFPRLLAHGTTVATNAVLEGRLARVALVTTRGFADVIEIARQARPSLYDQHVDRPPALVPRALRFEVSGRLDASSDPIGDELEAFDGRLPDGLVGALQAGEVDAVAVCLLHADVNPEHEHAVTHAVEQVLGRQSGRDVRVVGSHRVSPEFREYERTVTTVIDAALTPVCSGYLDALAAHADDVLVMTSAGGLVPLATAAEHPATLLVSGPAAGVRAAAALARECDVPNAVSFDMGGTSTDVCLVRGGAPEPSPTLVVGGYPVRLPALAVHTIGAGGGSVARVDPGGALVVGPESAGATPGPACYHRGGTEPTVTDADLVLGRIPETSALPGIGRLDLDASHAALRRLRLGTAEQAARAVVAVVDAAMERAVRSVTVEQGVDPRELALIAFGGAGPLHACAVAEALGMSAVVVPARAGVFSAVGLLCSPRQQSFVRSWVGRTSTDGLGDALARLQEEAEREVRRNGGETGDLASECFVDCRYVGQSHELTLPYPTAYPAAHPAAHPADGSLESGDEWESFHREHERRNGFARRDAREARVEVVALRVRVSLPAPLAIDDLPPVERGVVRGPAVVAEEDCTAWVPNGWIAEPGATGAWVIRRD